ncbi:MAG: Tfp pilus assembly protein PilF, partial [Enterobacterales bacterium]
EIPHAIALERSRTAIEKALQYDPFLPESYGILGLIEKTSFETEKANTNYQKAIGLNPNYADVYSWYSFNLDDQPNKQFELSTKAIQLNPMSMMVNLTYANNLLEYGKIDEAREVAEHMLSINDSHVFPYTLLGNINKIQGNYAQAAIFFTTAATNSSGRLESKYQLSDTLADMGLEEKAADYLKGIAHGIWSHLYRGNKELFLSQAREIYPRNEDDYLGAAYRAIAEMNDANYSEAIKFYTLSDINRFTDELIYAYKQVGNAEAAEALMDKTRATLTSRLDNNVQYWNVEPIEIRIMEVAYLDDDIELAIVNLKKAMDKGYIISFVYKTAPMFKKLRDHSEWPTLLAKSDKRASKQREIYLKLIAEKEATTL